MLAEAGGGAGPSGGPDRLWRTTLEQVRQEYADAETLDARVVVELLARRIEWDDECSWLSSA